MKFRTITTAVLLSLTLSSAAFALPGGQPKVHRVDKNEAQDRTGITRAVQSGKGSGMTRNQATFTGDAYRSQTAADTGKVKNNSGDRSPRYDDPAFRK